MGLTEDLARVRARREELERARARREADLQVATEHRDAALAELQETFQCDSIEEAERLLEALRAEVTQDIAAVEAALDEVLDE